MMLEKLVSTKPAAHRPPKTMRGTQVQKEAAVEADSSDDEDVDEGFAASLNMYAHVYTFMRIWFNSNTYGRSVDECV